MRKPRAGKTDALKNNSLNDGFTARPSGEEPVRPAESATDETKANVRDARALGYTDKKGRAVEMARPDVVGSPTGAYTDIGAGHSSAVKSKPTRH